MATLDTTRFGFEPDKRYTGTRMQQGRVLTDDDYNFEELRFQIVRSQESRRPPIKQGLRH